MVTTEGKNAYAKIQDALEAYFAKEKEIISIGATTDQELCRKAQEMAINELTPLYDALDAATLELMNINIEKENTMEIVCNILEFGAIILIVILIITAVIISKRIAHVISKGIAVPMTELQERFGSFAIHTQAFFNILPLSLTVNLCSLFTFLESYPSGGLLYHSPRFRHDTIPS